jgi:sec-independent protein translocase protein TatA
MELLVVLVIALLVSGPKRLPAAGRSLGRGITEFKAGISGRGDRAPIASQPADPDQPDRASVAPQTADAEKGAEART